MSPDPFPGVDALACAVSVTPRDDPERNEDACDTACVPRTGARGVVVADGLGSYSHAGQAARQVVRHAVEWLRDQTEDFGRAALPRLFEHVHGELRGYARDAAGGGDPEPQAFGTTLLVGLDTGAELVAAYAGNGAVWHIRGNFEADPSSGVPWSAVNLLNPHSVLRDGREVLYNIVDGAAERPPVPAVVSVRKDPRFGDILLLCTDGIYSADQVTHGTDAAGATWISAEATMVEFYRSLHELFAGWDGEAGLPLRDALHAWLAGLRARGVLEDDATAGVIVTADALRYRRNATAAALSAAAASPDAPGGAGEQPGPDGGTADDDGALRDGAQARESLETREEAGCIE